MKGELLMGVEALVDPQKIKSQYYSSGVYDCPSLALGSIFSSSFSQHTPQLAVRNMKVLRSLQANLSQVAYNLPGKMLSLHSEPCDEQNVRRN